jgi:hypothetical protein
MKTPEELKIQISDYDNRWNKMAAKIARDHLRAPVSPSKPSEKPEVDKNQSPQALGMNGQG